MIDSSLQAELIILRPTNIIPKPINKFAIFFIFLIKASITPIKQNKDKNKDILKLSKEAKSPVVVVPIFAPIIIAAACYKSIIFELTNPITINVVAADL